MYEQSEIQTTTSIIQRRGVKARKLDIAELTGSESNRTKDQPCETDDEDSLPEHRTKNISCLFPEVLSMIFCFLDVRSKGQVARVSRSWKDSAYRWDNYQCRQNNYIRDSRSKVPKYALSICSTWWGYDWVCLSVATIVTIPLIWIIW